MELPDEELEQRGLARAVRPYEAGDPFAEGSGECVEAEHLAVPLRDGRCFHDAVHPVITSTAFIRTYGEVLGDRKSTRLNSSHLVISYAVFCLKKKNSKNI